MHDLGRAHGPFTASGAFGDVDADNPEQSLLPRLGLLLRLVLIDTGEKFPASVELLSAAPVPQETIVPDFNEPIGQDVEKKATNEFLGAHGHDLDLVVIGIIPPSERDTVVVRFHDPVIADRYPVGVPAEILKNAFGPVERRFAVNDPLLLVQIGDQGIECRGLSKMAYRSGVNELVLGTESFQIGDKLSPKELRHHFDRQEKVIFARLPGSSVPGQSAAGDNVVDMGMVHEVLSPGVQDADKPDLDSEALWV